MKVSKQTIKESDQAIIFRGFLVMLIVLGFIWAKSSYGKIAGGTFVQSLGGMLSKNAQNNPYPFYTEFLKAVAIPNSVLFGNLTMWGEFLTAVSLIGGSLYLLFKNSHEKLAYIVLIAGLIGGVFLNLNFWFAFSWTSPSNDSLNLLMTLLQIIGALTLFKVYKKNFYSVPKSKE